mmetsp:Transcript_18983/g.44077  ORF Transcript_18983/g.44077 Transcript_18983/m.44077 type:complete len:227 (-) Transcript_18983:74-754(-)
MLSSGTASGGLASSGLDSRGLLSLLPVSTHRLTFGGFFLRAVQKGIAFRDEITWTVAAGASGRGGAGGRPSASAAVDSIVRFLATCWIDSMFAATTAGGSTGIATVFRYRSSDSSCRKLSASLFRSYKSGQHSRRVLSLHISPGVARLRWRVLAAFSPMAARTRRDFPGCCQAHSNWRAILWVGNPLTSTTNSQGRPDRRVFQAPPFLRIPLCCLSLRSGLVVKPT